MNNRLSFLLVFAVLIVTACTHAGPEQISSAVTAVPLTDQTVNAGESLTIHPGPGCNLRTRSPAADVLVTCITVTPGPATTATATVAPISTPSATSAVPTPTVPPTVAPSPTPAKSGVFALGARLDAGDTVTLNAWNAKVRAGDNSHSDNQNLLLSVKAGDLSQSVGSVGIVYGAASDAIDGRLQDALVSNGRITDVSVNDEAGKLCPELQSDEAYEYAKFAKFNAAHGTHITMSFAPVGTRIADCGVQAFIHNTDKLIDQVEARQIDANFAAEVHAEIHALRAARPGLPIFTQVSTLPPRTTTYSVAKVIADIDALMDGSADQPDSIQIFYAGRGSVRDNDSDGVAEADEFISVLNHYRP